MSLVAAVQVDSAKVGIVIHGTVYIYISKIKTLEQGEYLGAALKLASSSSLPLLGSLWRLGFQFAGWTRWAYIPRLSITVHRRHFLESSRLKFLMGVDRRVPAA